MNDVLTDFVKSDVYHKSHNNWDQTSERKVLSANARREEERQAELKEARLADRRKRLQALLEAETEEYLTELESMRSRGTDQERVQKLRDQVAVLREKKECRRLASGRPLSAPAEGSNEIRSLCQELEEQLRVKRAHLQSLQEKEEREDSARKRDQERRWQRETERELEQERDRELHARQLRDLAFEAQARKMTLARKQREDDRTARAELQMQLDKEVETERREQERMRSALNAQRAAQTEERERKRREEQQQRIRDLETSNRELGDQIKQQQREEAHRRLSVKEERLFNLRTRELEKDRDRLLWAKESLRLQDQETLLEEDRRGREAVLAGAQVRLRQQVEAERRDQLRARVLEREREAQRRQEEAQLCQMQAEEWLRQQQLAKEAARKRQEIYAQQLQDQMYYKSLNLSL